MRPPHDVWLARVLVAMVIGRLVGWLAGWLVGWLAGWLIGACNPVLFDPGRGLQVQWVRPEQACPRAEGDEQPVVSLTRFELVEEPRLVTPTEASFLRKKKLEYTPRVTEQTTNLLSCNAHLLSSELLRTLIMHLCELQRVPNDNAPHRQRPWELIWPQTKHPTTGVAVPTYNPSGKYAVKLFWLGYVAVARFFWGPSGKTAFTAARRSCKYTVPKPATSAKSPFLFGHHGPGLPNGHSPRGDSVPHFCDAVAFHFPPWLPGLGARL